MSNNIPCEIMVDENTGVKYVVIAWNNIVKSKPKDVSMEAVKRMPAMLQKEGFKPLKLYDKDTGKEHVCFYRPFTKEDAEHYKDADPIPVKVNDIPQKPQHYLH